MSSNPTPEIPAAHPWPTNAALINDVARLYLSDIERMLDATYGLGAWWTEWKPPILITNDLDPDTRAEHHDDFRDLPWPDGFFDAVAFDPPYKLNGTPALGDFDTRYGIDHITRWQDRVQIIMDGFTECARVLDTGGYLLVKVQDQVVSGQVRWLTIGLANLALTLDLRLVDRFDLLGGSRPQPAGRRQLHARARPSTLMVWQRRGGRQ